MEEEKGGGIKVQLPLQLLSRGCAYGLCVYKHITKTSEIRYSRYRHVDDQEDRR